MREALTLRQLARPFAVLLFVVVAGCSSGDECRRAAGVDDGGPGACTAGRGYVACGDGVFCITDTQSCPGFKPAECENSCSSNEYAVSCGGPPAAFPYADAPANCRGITGTPFGNEFYCCPCL